MPAPTVKLHTPEGMPPPTGYSQVAEVSGGKLVYIAGQVPRDATGALVGKGDFRAQLEQVFRNVDTAVKAAGGTFANVVKLNYYCVDTVDLGDMSTVREVRGRFVNAQNPPASTFVVVRRLVSPDWLIEIEAVAVI